MTKRLLQDDCWEEICQMIPAELRHPFEGGLRDPGQPPIPARIIIEYWIHKKNENEGVTLATLLQDPYGERRNYNLEAVIKRSRIFQGEQLFDKIEKRFPELIKKSGSIYPEWIRSDRLSIEEAVTQTNIEEDRLIELCDRFKLTDQNFLIALYGSRSDIFNVLSNSFLNELSGCILGNHATQNSNGFFPVDGDLLCLLCDPNKLITTCPNLFEEITCKLQFIIEALVKARTLDMVVKKSGHTIGEINRLKIYWKIAIYSSMMDSTYCTEGILRYLRKSNGVSSIVNKNNIDHQRSCESLLDILQNWRELSPGNIWIVLVGIGISKALLHLKKEPMEFFFTIAKNIVNSTKIDVILSSAVFATLNNIQSIDEKAEFIKKIKTEYSRNYIETPTYPNTVACSLLSCEEPLQGKISTFLDKLKYWESIENCLKENDRFRSEGGIVHAAVFPNEVIPEDIRRYFRLRGDPSKSSGNRTCGQSTQILA